MTSNKSNNDGKPTAFPFVSTYKRMTGNCTKYVAEDMVRLATSLSSFEHTSYTPHPITSSSYVLDNACGPGIVLSAIKTQYPDTSFRIMAADLTPDMLSQVSSLVSSEPDVWSNTPVETVVQDARNLDKLADNSFSHVFTSFGLGIPGDIDNNARKACAEMYRVLQTSGVAVVSTWADRVFPIAWMRALRRVQPDASEEVPGRMSISLKHLSATWLMETIETAGFGQNVLVVPVTTYTEAASMEELLQNMSLAKGAFWQDCNQWTEQQMEKAMEALAEELKSLRTFEQMDNGSVRIGMRAWVALGWKDETSEQQVVPC